MPNALEAWIEDGLQATRRAATVASWVRGLAGIIVVLGLIGIVVIALDSDAEEVGSIVAYLALTIAVSGALLAAVASALDMLRIQAESALFNEDDENDGN
jgi:hypothetical protein